MRAWAMLLGLTLACADYPPYFLGEIQSVLAFSDGSGFGSLSTRAVQAVTQQVFHDLRVGIFHDLRVGIFHDLRVVFSRFACGDLWHPA